MRARFQLGMLKFADPRVIRGLLIGLTLVLFLLARTGIAYAGPIDGDGGCGGG